MSNDERRGGIADFGISFGTPGSGGGEQAASSSGATKAAPVAEDSGLNGPFRIVVVSQVTAGADYSTGADPVATVHRLTRSELDRVMAELAPSFALEIDSPLHDKPLRVDLRWERMKALKVPSIIEQVPTLRSLVDARRVLENLLERRIARDAARIQLSRLLPEGRFNDELCRSLAADDAAPAPAAASAPAAPAAPAAKAPPAGGGLDALLAQVDIAAPAAGVPDPATSASSLVSAVAKAAVAGRPEAAGATSVDRAFSSIENAFGSILDAILRHPETHRLEATWRGLWLLLEHANTGAGVEVDLFPVCDDGEAITRALTQLVQREGIHEAERAPIDLVIVDRCIGSSQADLKLMEAWGTLAEVLRAPLVLGASHELVGVDQLSDLAYSERRLGGSTDARAVAARAIAGRDAARWLCLTLNNVLVRPAFTTETSRSKEVPFGQTASEPRAHVFAGAYWAVACLAAESYVRTGLGTALTGGTDGLLHNLPVHNIEDRGESAAVPVEVFISSEAQAELARAGITALGCARNRDMAILTQATMLHREPSRSGGDAAAADSTLADQLFVGRFSHAVEMVAAAIPAHAAPSAIADVARIALADFFRNPPPVGPEIEARGVDGLLEVTVRPRRFAGISLQEVTLAAPLAR